MAHATPTGKWSPKLMAELLQVHSDQQQRTSTNADVENPPTDSSHLLEHSAENPLPGSTSWSIGSQEAVEETPLGSASAASAKGLPTGGPRVNELFFDDGLRRIDMVLAFSEDSIASKHSSYRAIFEHNLRKDGLQLELEDKANSSSGDVYFLKIHATWEVLSRYAEALNLKMPLRVDEEENAKEETVAEKLSHLKKWLNAFFPATSVLIHQEAVYQKTETRTSNLTAPFIRARAANFAIDSPATFFLPSQRSMIVWHILSRTSFRTEKKKEMVGISKLLKYGVYKACFPLHDGDHRSRAVPAPIRSLLYRQWGTASAWCRQQPLPLVRDYFGDKVGLYFAWLGFYTNSLVAPALVGFLCFFYGVFSIDSPENIVSHEICNASLAANLMMCPVCNQVCPYWRLGDSCLYSKISYLFDNYATCFFAIFMSVWATAFLEAWKRRQAQLSWEWDLMESGYLENYDEEVRPEYELRAGQYRISPVSKRREPYIPMSRRAAQYIVSGAGVAFVCICLIVAMLLIIMYRLAIISYFSNISSPTVHRYAKLMASASASFIQLVLITVFKPIGRKLARVLTEYEAPRTQSDFLDNYTLKVFAFDFINVYSSLIYIAIFKGRFYGHPGESGSMDYNFNIIRTDACDPSGCFFELCIQMAIIMVGRQVSNNIVEIIWPKIQIWRRNRQAIEAERSRRSRDRLSRWEADYNLQTIDALSLNEEYNEMVIQYGLVTLFVAAFPLAPFFALLNNIIEIRVDAYKIATQFRRPIAQRVANIGVWMEILKVVTYFAVVTNAFVIAFASEFVPRLVHLYNNNFHMDGYLNFTLSVFNTSLYADGMGPLPEVDGTNVTHCHYRAMRYDSNDPQRPHELSNDYWLTVAARLCFAVSFEHVVIALTGILTYCIPDIPSSVRDKLARERHLEREALVAQESTPDGVSGRRVKSALVNGERSLRRTVSHQPRV